MEKLLLVGAGGLGRVVLEHAKEKYECYFVDDGLKKGEMVCGTEIVGNTNDLTILFNEYKKLIVTIGDNKVREKIYKNATEIGFDFPNIICKSAYISKYASVGYGCIILNNVVVQNNSYVGNGVILNPGVELHHDSRTEDYALIYTNTVVRSLAFIGKRAKIGSTLTIGNRVLIAEDMVIDDGMTIT